MKLSVIIPTFNRDNLLCETISQVLNQDYTDFELLIVDQTKQHDQYTVNFLSQLPPAAKLIKASIPNLPAARNIGVKNSIGDIIVFIDDDMILPTDILTKLALVYTERNDVFALSGFGETPTHPEENKMAILNKRDRKRNLNGVKTILNVPTFNGYFMTFRRNVFDTVGFFDEWMGTQPKSAAEDFEFCHRLKINGYKLYLYTDLTVIHLASTEGGCEARKEIETEYEYLMYNRSKLRFYAIYKNVTNYNMINLLSALFHNLYTFFIPIIRVQGILGSFKFITKFIELNRYALQTAKSNRGILN